MFNPKTQTINLNVFIDCIYAATADGVIPTITGFGNNLSQRIAENMFDEYPILLEYYESDEKRKEAFSRYLKVIK